MGKLDDVSAAALRDALDDATGAKEATRLLLALAYKDGVEVDTLTERYGVPESTVYSWLDRFETEPIEAAATDDARPGRPSKLSPAQRRQVTEWLRASPREYGHDATEWTPALLRERIAGEFGVTYSRGHLRRLREELSPDSE
jgi:transposase